MSQGMFSRRDFLTRSGGVFGAAWLAANFPAIAAAATEASRVASGEVEESFDFFSAADGALIDAISSLIVPSEGAGPGAREAKVAVFIDRVMTGFMKSGADGFVVGLQTFARAFADAWPQEASFAAAKKTAQVEFFATQVDSDFFGLVHFLTHVGMFALPSYGGNFQKKGWQLMRFEDRHVFYPPFGHYDRDYPGFETVAARYRKES
ncbi:MAG: gluconate 2-dehydrogenase subunit 3 family protein [Gammaproteobacteria bacterium]|nr:gluconate 2-dehydrogenase subunit 3 family protein [Gammaproteobacteria bacterium]MCZ6827286.1 gluconate 2-dehydrogenase subunit 3 family protein [Gammaproteobacteria bacterium]